MIDGDAGFVAKNGVRAGTGRKDDPFIVEGWRIPSSAANSIEIKNTNSFFVVRNVRIEVGAGTKDFQPSGVSVSDVANATIESSLITANSRLGRGITITRSSNVVVEDVQIEKGDDGIRIEGSTEVVVKHNRISAGFDGIFVTNSTTGAKDLPSANFSANLDIADNQIYSNTHYGIYLTRVESVVVRQNEIHGNGTGISMHITQNVSIVSNRIHKNSRVGIGTSGTGTAYKDTRTITNRTRRSVVRDNDIGWNGVGVQWNGTEDGLLEGNYIHNNDDYGIQAAFGKGNIYRSNIIEGNYFGMWLGPWSSVYRVVGTDEKDAQIYGNLFVGNVLQAYDSSVRPNTWDGDGKGNSWCDYAHEGAYPILGGSSQDRYPRATFGPASPCLRLLWWTESDNQVQILWSGDSHNLRILSRDNVSLFSFDPILGRILFTVSRAGPIEVHIPASLMTVPWKVRQPPFNEFPAGELEVSTTTGETIIAFSSHHAPWGDPVQILIEGTLVKPYLR